MSGATPTGSPAALFPVTSRKFDRLMPARRMPVGASSDLTSGDLRGAPGDEKMTAHHTLKEACTATFALGGTRFVTHA
jgi:hypothetical protein